MTCCAVELTPANDCLMCGLRYKEDGNPLTLDEVRPLVKTTTVGGEYNPFAGFDDDEEESDEGEYCEECATYYTYGESCACCPDCEKYPCKCCAICGGDNKYNCGCCTECENVDGECTCCDECGSTDSSECGCNDEDDEEGEEQEE